MIARIIGIAALVAMLAGCASAAKTDGATAAARPSASTPAPAPVVAPPAEPPRQADALARISSELAELQNAVAKLMLGARQHDDQLVYLQRRLTELETQARSRAASPVPGFAPTPPAALPPPPVAPPPTTASATPLSPTSSPSAAVRPDAAPARPQSPPSDADAEEVFQSGLAKYQAGDLDGAVVIFYEVVASYPTHPVRERAQFLIGDILYTQKDYRGAVAELEGLIKAAPKSTRVPDALLKLGMAHRALGEESQAKRTWQRLVKEYPSTTAARQAKTLMRASKG